MSVFRISKEKWPRWKKRIVAFVRQHKDKHITRETSAKLRALTKLDLGEPGTLVLAATENNRLAGVLVGKDYGKDCSLAVVRRSTRSRGLGKELLRRAVAQLGSFHVQIAADNVPSLKVAFGCGLLGYAVFVRDNGKVILVLKTFDNLCKGEDVVLEKRGHE